MHRFREMVCVGVLDDFERGEAGAKHEQELVAEHLSGRAQLAAIVVALAQEARLGYKRGRRGSSGN